MDYDCTKQIGCPAMIIEEGRVRIDAESCIGCSICAQICPEKAIVPQKRAEGTC
jgi:indolepyruvate ferredoxin oxidoreductase, alpha subunit